MKITGRFKGPVQRKEYERALGEFLVAFNRMENMLREIVELSLEVLGRPEYWKQIKGQGLHEQVRYITLLGIGSDLVPDVPGEQMLELNSSRNALAHGHYYERFDREGYTIVGKEKERAFPIADIARLVVQATEINGELERDYMRLVNYMDDQQELMMARDAAAASDQP